MSKDLIIKFSNGDTFAIDADYIAAMRAEYYASKDCEKDKSLKYDAVYQEEFDYGRSEDVELLDWINNNVNWRDIKHKVRRIIPDPVEYNHADEFGDADITVKTIK